MHAILGLTAFLGIVALAFGVRAAQIVAAIVLLAGAAVFATFVITIIMVGI